MQTTFGEDMQGLAGGMVTENLTTIIYECVSNYVAFVQIKIWT